MEGNLIHMLDNLVALDFDAIDAYEAAIERLKEAGDRDQMHSFMLDHIRHTTEVGAVVRQLGGTPPVTGDFKRVLTKGKVVLAGLIDDRAVLFAMKTNETDTNTAYERATRHKGLTPEIKMLLEKNLSDERRHKAWIEQRLEAFAQQAQRSQ
jgi:rubrerythrin